MREQDDIPMAATAADNRPGTWIDVEQLGIPWFDFEIQQAIAWRDGDVVISVPQKCGTTWTMNIVHQLRTGGDPDFEDVYVEVPWLELLPNPSASPADVVRRIDSMPTDRRRAFKTHCGAGPLPYQAANAGKDVRYVVVLRNPDEVIASLYPFILSIAPDWYDYWGVDRSQFTPPDIESFFEGFAQTILANGLFGFLAAWWPLRSQPNVQLMHFSDMKRDHEGSVRKIAEFLEFTPTLEQWSAILEYTSFPWMKQHEDKFEARLAADVPILVPGGMVRKGKIGASSEDGVTPEMSGQLRDLGEQILTDKQAIDWLYSGGELP